MGEDEVMAQQVERAVETPGRTCGVIMSRVSAARRPAARMPAKSSGA